MTVILQFRATKAPRHPSKVQSTKIIYAYFKYLFQPHSTAVFLSPLIRVSYRISGAYEFCSCYQCEEWMCRPSREVAEDREQKGRSRKREPFYYYDIWRTPQRGACPMVVSRVSYGIWSRWKWNSCTVQKISVTDHDGTKESKHRKMSMRKGNSWHGHVRWNLQDWSYPFLQSKIL